MKRNSPCIYSRSRVWTLICSSSVAVLGIIICLLWLDRDVSAVTPRPSAAAAPLSARLHLNAPVVFTYPLTSTLDICDTFGPRLLTDGARSRYTFHLGVNWCAAEGAPVYAVTTGTVQSSNDTCAGAAACFVHLTHAAIDGQTRYDHLSGVAGGITTGLQITPGQTIGWVGSDGGSSPAYLHFEVHDGLTVTERAAIHPLRTPFLPWTNAVSPTVALSGVYTDATGMTALVQVTSPYTESDLITVSVVVTGTVTASRTLDYEAINAAVASTAALEDPLVQTKVRDVCVIPMGLNKADGYEVTMAFRQLNYGLPVTVTAYALDVTSRSATDTLRLTGGLEMTPPTKTVAGGVGRAITLIYTLTNRIGATDIFTLTHLSAQGWPASLTPTTATLSNGQSVTVTARITISTDRVVAPDCGLVVAQGTPVSASPMVAGFYRLFTHIPLSGVGLAGPMAGVVQAGYRFTATVSPPTATLPITYTWQATGQGDVVESVSDLSYTRVLTWATAGAKHITVTAVNVGGAVTATHVVTISVPPSGVGIAGPTAGTIDGAYTFTATVAPPTVTLPITYTWQATGQSDVVESVSDLSHTSILTWATAGAKNITVTAVNVGGAVTETRVVTISVPPSGVSIAGPTRGVINGAYTFTATVLPPTATLPITYAWQASGLAPQIHLVDDVTDTVMFQWGGLGQQTVTVTARNAGGVVSSTHAITITAASFPFYDGFEAGALGAGWTVVTDTQGRVQVSSSYRYSGSYSVLLDNRVESDTKSTATSVLNIDLSGRVGAVLEFWWREFDDENHAADGVFISDDNGASWHQILSFNDGPASFRREVIYLDAWAATHGLSFNDHFQIGFQYYDDWPVPDDGYAIDEVRVRPEAVTGVEIGGATRGNVHTPYTFTATVAPPTATLPITYTWSPEPTAGQGAAVVTYTWPVTGVQTVQVTATNVSGSASNSHVITINVPPGGVSVAGPAEGIIGAGYRFTATVAPPTATLPITYTWQATGQSDVVTKTGRLSHSVVFTWATAGAKQITVTAANVGGAVTANHVVTISVPPGGVSVAGPAAGIINRAYTFTATVAPPTTTLPIIYTWRATGQGDVTALVKDVSHAVTWTWTEPGVKGITVTAANVGGVVTETHVVTISVPPGGVSIAGLTEGVINGAYTFTATVTPPKSTLPITYTWQASGLAPQMHLMDDVTDTVTFRWGALGQQTVTVTARNAGGVVSSTHAITITAASFPFYDGFEAGALGEGWTVVTETQGRVQVSSAYPYSGSYSVLLDDELANTSYSTSALILTLDLAEQVGVVLDFWWREFEDDDHPVDGVFISADGVIWTKVFTWTTGSPPSDDYRHTAIHLDPHAAAHGLSFNDHFQIKFQYYDNHPVPFDGYSVDEVRVRPEAVTGVEIDGPTQSNVHVPYTFTAAVEPPTATLPVTYTWSPEPTVGQRTAVATYKWSITGSKTVSVEAINVSGSAIDSHTITVNVPPDGVSIAGLAEGVIGVGYGLTATVNPPTATRPITYNWQATEQVDVTYSANDVRHGLVFTWSTPGPKLITVTAVNVGGVVTGTHVVTISIPPVDVILDGQATGVVQVDYLFTAQVSPITATLPLTYLWEAMEQAPVVHGGRGISDSIRFNWGITGSKLVTVTVSNVGGVVAAAHVITLGISPLNSLTVDGPIDAVAYVNTPFTATVTPVTATQPITYIWEATHRPGPVVHSGRGFSDAHAFTWRITGTQTITVTAINVGGTVSVTRVITVLSATAPESVTIAGPTEGVVQAAHAFTATVSPVSTTVPITYVWQATGGLSETHMNDRKDVAYLAWESPGVQVVTVTAMNPVGAVSATRVITTRVSPLTDVQIDGPVEGGVGVPYTFTATVSPLTATLPVTYHWRASDQGNVITTGQALSHTVSWAWSTPGVREIIVTATNVGGTVIDTAIITIHVPPDGIRITGPTAGLVATSYSFTATVSPPSVTLPITYHWQALGTDQTDVVTSTRAISDVVSFAWDEPGGQVITVTVENEGGAVTAVHSLTLSVPPYDVEIIGPTAGNAGTALAFTANVHSPTTTIPITYHWQATGQSDIVVVRHARDHSVFFTWDKPGLQVITVTATNAGGVVTDTHYVVVSIPLDGVEISGPTVGSSGKRHAFTATVSPPTATLPITYHWQATGQSDVVVKVEAARHVISLTWLTAGAQGITVTAINARGAIVGQHVVTISISPLEIEVSGSGVVVVGEPVTLTASVSPVTTTLPITYHWRASGQGDFVVALTDRLESLVSFRWDTPGVKGITVTATNEVGMATGTHIITVYVPPTRTVVSGPTVGNVDQSYTFTATVCPPSTTTPIAYNWRAMGQTDVMVVDDLEHALSWAWSEPGMQVITVTAANMGGMVTGTHVITVYVPPTEVLIGGRAVGGISRPYTFTANVSPVTTTVPITYMWRGTGQEDVVAVVDGPTHAVSWTWSEPGMQVITVTAANGGGVVMGTRSIQIYVLPSQVSINGPEVGSINTDYAFEALVSPTTATQPLHYTWAPMPVTGQGSPAVTYRWATPGLQTVVVTATNDGGSAHDTHTIMIGVPIQEVEIAGPAQGKINAPHVFNAVVTPSTATQPMAYTWSPPPTAGQGTAVVQYVWNVTGTRSISVAVSNIGGTVLDSQILHIELYDLYLPMIMRSWPPKLDLYSIDNPGGDNDYTVRWSSVTEGGEVTYFLQESRRCDDGFIGVVEYSTTEASYTFERRKAGRYCYQVRACGNGWCGPWSNVVCGDVLHEQENNDLREIGLSDGPICSGPVYQGIHNDDSDYFAMYLGAGEHIAIDLNTPLGSGVWLLLYYGTESQSRERDYQPPYHVEYTAPRDGWYYIRVYTPPEQHSSGESYTLRAVFP